MGRGGVKKGKERRWRGRKEERRTRRRGEASQECVGTEKGRMSKEGEEIECGNQWSSSMLGLYPVG